MSMGFGIGSTLFQTATSIAPGAPGTFLPREFGGSRKELLACRETAWLGSNLNMSPVYDVSGPDAAALLTRVCVNRDFSKTSERGCRHAIICNEQGQMLADGVIIRLGEDSFRTYWMAPVLAYYVETLGMDVVGTYDLGEYFFQLDGPRSLEILERVCGSDLHDLKFAQHKLVDVNGMQMRVLRLGMSGSLAYEVHGPAQDADAIYAAIRDTGKEFGVEELGCRNYCANHTTAGYPNQNIHYQYPLFESGADMAAYMERNWMVHPFVKTFVAGSCANDRSEYYVTPYDVGWGYLVNFDHEFQGKEALQAIAQNPPAVPVTLEWDAEDVARVFASNFRGQDVEPFEDIDAPWEAADTMPCVFRMEKVLAGGEQVGRTAGRTRDYYHRRMVSIADVKPEFAAEGTELNVLYGTPGRPQTEIRATVARFPYYNGEWRNETFDVERIPRLA